MDSPVASTDTATTAEWINRAIDEGVKPEQALAFIGLGLMHRLGNTEASFSPLGQDGVETADLATLRQRLELIDLAIRTAAPLSTAEVTALLGARPGAAEVERGGLAARRVSRNVWRLSRLADRPQTDDAFRRRF
jgi:HAMP domain-containing protein